MNIFSINQLISNAIRKIIETDPVFTAWDRKDGIEITASQVTDFDTEVSNNTDVQKGVTAEGWGDHSLVGYLTEELDPVFSSWDKKPLLDTYTQTEANLADAVSKKHSHVNQTALDNVQGVNTGDQDWGGLSPTKRQIILTARTDSDGLNNSISAGTGLQAVLNASNDTPFVATLAYGYRNNLQENFRVYLNSNQTFDNLTANTTNYLYIDRDINTGAITYGKTLLQPIDTTITPATPSVDQHWFEPNTFLMKVYNGTSWDIKQRIFVGEAITDAGAVTSTRSYAIQGMYRYKRTADMASGAKYTFNHNLGTDHPKINAYLVCTTSEHGYAVGDTAIPHSRQQSGTAEWAGHPLSSEGRNTFSFSTGANGVLIFNKSTYFHNSITYANWDLVVEAERSY